MPRFPHAYMHACLQQRSCILTYIHKYTNFQRSSICRLVCICMITTMSVHKLNTWEHKCTHSWTRNVQAKTSQTCESIVLTHTYRHTYIHTDIHVYTVKSRQTHIKANSLHKCKHSSIEAYKRLYEYVKKTKKHTYTYVYIHTYRDETETYMSTHLHIK